MKIRCIIIDDEYLARQYLKDYIQKLPFLDFIGDFNSPLKAIDIIKSGKVDLLFLDIQMPDITGLEFLRTLKNPPYVIITTAHKEFAIEGYELNVCDYLLKPFSFERFITASNKVLGLMGQKEDGKTSSTTSEQQTTLHKGYLVVKADRKLNKINYEDLIYIEGQKAYVTFHTESRNITALASLKELEEQLPHDIFVRIHKSYIVSVKKILSLEGNLIEISDRRLPVGKSYRKEVERIFGLENQ